MQQRTITLASGAAMPAVGLGTYKLADRTAVATALDLGYRHIDTATAYHNEELLGAALRDSAIDREQLFITSKLRNADHAAGDVRGALERSLRALRTDYLDLYLIHWPLPHENRYLAAWEALLQAQHDGLLVDVGVANFLGPHLQRLIESSGVAPAVNQIEFHPTWHTPALVAACQAQGTVVEAYSPLARGADFAAPAVQAAAAAHNATPAQVVLTWALQQGVAVIPKSASPQRLAENVAVAADPAPLTLSATEMAALSALDGTGQMGHDPNTYSGLQL